MFWFVVVPKAVILEATQRHLAEQTLEGCLGMTIFVRLLIDIDTLATHLSSPIYFHQLVKINRGKGDQRF